MSSAEDALAIDALQEVFGRHVEILRGPWLLAGGTMHPSWGVDVAAEGASKPLELVVRTTPPGRGDVDIARREYASIQASVKRGATAPSVHGVGELPSGDAYVIMGRVEGDSNPRPLLRDARFGQARALIVSQLIDALARIHSVPLSEIDAELVGPAPGQDPLLHQCELLEAKYQEDRLDRQPVIEWALRWVERRAAGSAPAHADLTLSHGDFRIGNILYDADGLTAVLDWEAAHVSEPIEDLAWFCVKVWRFGQNHLEAGGLVRREEWLKAYEAASGRSIDRRRFPLWEVLMNIRWAIITLNQVKSHVTGIVRSQELAAIGRRTAETDLEILRLIRGMQEAPHAG